MPIGTKLECRCGHTWFQREDKLPKRCPKCHTYRWAEGYEERFAHYCERCRYNWESGVISPRRCQRCKSEKWQEREKEYV